MFGEEDCAKVLSLGGLIDYCYGLVCLAGYASLNGYRGSCVGAVA